LRLDHWPPVAVTVRAAVVVVLSLLSPSVVMTLAMAARSAPQRLDSEISGRSGHGMTTTNRVLLNPLSKPERM
jgi:hypothetical protein